MIQSKDVSELAHPETTIETKNEHLPETSTKQQVISTAFPKIPDDINNIPLPFIREHGIKNAMDFLAEYFSCADYRNNLAQFGFLDILIDCIWRLQDEFHLVYEQQKIVLEWWIFMLKLLISRNDMTKNLFFDIFNEAMTIAEEYIFSRGPLAPIPKNLFQLIFEEGNNKESKMSLQSFRNQSQSYSLRKLNDQYVCIKYEDDLQVFKLPFGTNIQAEKYSIASSLEVLKEKLEKDIQTATSNDSTTDFYQPDLSTPSRFKSLVEFQEQFITSERRKCEDYWYKVPNVPRHLCSREILLKTSTNEIACTDERNEIFDAFYKYNLWKLQNNYMADPKLGWTSSLETDFQNIEDLQPNVKKHKLIINQAKELENVEKDENIFVNSYVLLIIKETIIDCFSTHFSFELIKRSLKQPKNLISEEIISEWLIPKTIKVEIKRPNPKKPKKEKTKPNDKVETSPKSPKNKETKFDKSGEKKSSKQNKPQSENKVTTKLSKDEKKELERERKEKAELEKQRMKEEENKRLMFPLRDAVDEQFFYSIFPNYKPQKKNANKKLKN